MDLLKRLINLVNAPLAVGSLALDIVYIIQVPFHVPSLHKVATLVLLAKAMLSVLVMWIYYNKFVRNYKVQLCSQ